MYFEKKIDFRPAFDRRSDDPKKNYGIHGVEICWSLIGEDGAISFILYTNWHLPHVQAELDEKVGESHTICHPMPADVGYHAKAPQFEGQILSREKCHLLGGPCYYDGSGMRADAVYQILLAQGGDAVWADLEKRYKEQFGVVQ